LARDAVDNQARLRRSIQVQARGPPHDFDLHFGPRFQFEIGVCVRDSFGRVFDSYSARADWFPELSKSKANVSARRIPIIVVAGSVPSFRSRRIAGIDAIPWHFCNRDGGQESGLRNWYSLMLPLLCVVSGT
ncbi:MAG: hypothetical protein QOJ99_2700, partial [Bryobacterales bacterium]|nr:hypothetical protein [Bryobacterales bacterium]